MHNLDIGEINRPEVCSQYVGVHYLIMHVTLCVKSPTFHLSLLPGLFTHMFVCQTSAATQHTVIDKIRHMNVFVCGRLSYCYFRRPCRWRLWLWSFCVTLSFFKQENWRTQKRTSTKLGRHGQGVNDPLEIDNFWWWSGSACGFHITFLFSSPGFLDIY